MLSKLLRHEFRATGRILLPLYLLLFVTAGMFHVSMLLRNNERIGDDWAAKVFSIVSISAFCVAIIGISILAVALMIYRFYKNLMTDEGYLMFTLPVTTHQIIISKLIVSLVWSAVTFVADLLAIALAMYRIVAVEELREVWQKLMYLLHQFSTGEIVGYSIEIVLFAVFSLVASLLMYYAAIALGHSFANHKILLSVVFYFVFAIALNIIHSVIGVIGLGVTSFNGNEMEAVAVVHWGMIGGILLAVIQVVVFYFLTNGMLRKRLNLQ